MSDGCLLDRFLPWSAAQSALALSHTFELPTSPWAILFDVVAMVSGLLLLIHGSKLNATVLFVIGFVCAAAILSAATSGLLQALGWQSCLILTAVPLAGGTVCGLAVRSSPKGTFFLLGFCVGGVLGYYVYSVIHVLLLELLLFPALVCGCLSVCLESKILEAATAIVGAFIFMLGFTYLVLGRIDSRFARWLTPAVAEPDIFTVIPLLMALGLAVSGGTLQKLWGSARKAGAQGLANAPLLSNPFQRKKTPWQKVKDFWDPPQSWWQKL